MKYLILMFCLFVFSCSAQKPELATTEDLNNLKTGVLIEQCLTEVVSIAEDFNRMVMHTPQSKIDATFADSFLNQIKEVKSCKVSKETVNFKIAVSVVIVKIVRACNYANLGQQEQFKESVKEVNKWEKKADAWFFESKAVEQKLLGVY